MSDATRLVLLRIALIVIGLTFIFGIYTLGIVWPSGWTWGHGHSHYLLMIIGVYATLGVFLRIASRDPYAHKSIIWFTVWSSGSWRDHGCSGLQRWGRKRPLDRRCPGALSRGDRSRGVDAPDCATISTCRLMSAVSAAPQWHVSRGENFGLTVVRRLPRLYRGVRSVFNNPDNDIWTGRAFKRSLVMVRRGGLNRGQPHL